MHLCAGLTLRGEGAGGAVPPGMIDFTGADLSQVLYIYAVMSQRTILRPAILPAPTVRLKTQGALTKEEVLYAFETVLALNGICVVDDGAKFVQVVPMPQRGEERRAPPNRSQGQSCSIRRRCRQWEFPVLWLAAFTDGLERLEQEFERLKRAFYDFLHFPDPVKRPAAQRLFELYAGLADKTAVASTNFDGTGIWFHVETPLTRGELLYAIETTFELHNLVIIPVDDRRIRLGHISEVLRNNAGRLERVRPRGAD